MFKIFVELNMNLSEQKVNSNLSSFQKNLKNNKEIQSDYLSAEFEDDEDDEQDEVRVVIPNKKRVDPSTELLNQLIKQNEALSNAQKKSYKLQSELDKEEIISRYIKLDLNNIQVKLDEMSTKMKIYKKSLFQAKVENWVTRMLILLYMVWSGVPVVYSVFNYGVTYSLSINTDVFVDMLCGFLSACLTFSMVFIYYRRVYSKIRKD